MSDYDPEVVAVSKDAFPGCYAVDINQWIIDWQDARSDGREDCPTELEVSCIKQMLGAFVRSALNDGYGDVGIVALVYQPIQNVEAITRN